MFQSITSQQMCRSSHWAHKMITIMTMNKPALSMVSPNRRNISYAVKVVTDPPKIFQFLVKDLKEQKGNCEWAIIYCQTIKVTTSLYGFFLSDDMYNYCFCYFILTDHDLFGSNVCASCVLIASQWTASQLNQHITRLSVVISKASIQVDDRLIMIPGKRALWFNSLLVP